MKNQISYKLAVSRMYVHGYEVTQRVMGDAFLQRFKAINQEQYNKWDQFASKQAKISAKYEEKIKQILSSLIHAEKKMSRPQVRELYYLIDKCPISWLNEIQETRSNVHDAFWLDCLALDTFDDFDPGVDDFDPIEDFNESRLDYMEDNFQDYGDEGEFSW